MNDFIETAITAAGVNLQTSPAEQANHFVCVMTSSRSVMKRTMTMREGYDAPALGSLILYYAELLQPVYTAEDVLDWASEFDYDVADNKILEKFDGLVKTETDMRLLLGDNIYHTMMAGLEIHQAISRARPR